MNSESGLQHSNPADTGIRMHSVFVENISYRLDVSDGERPDSFPVDVEIIIETREEPPFGFVRFIISCEHPQEISVGHSLKARLVAVYEQIGKETSVPFARFLEQNAPAAMFAFARELVYSVTSRSAIPPILLDPINMLKVMGSGRIRYREGNSQQEQSQPMASE